MLKSLQRRGQWLVDPDFERSFHLAERKYWEVVAKIDTLLMKKEKKQYEEDQFPFWWVLSIAFPGMDELQKSCSKLKRKEPLVRNRTTEYLQSNGNQQYPWLYLVTITFK